MFLPKPLAYAIIGAVTAIWCGSQIAAIFMMDYTTDPMLHTIFMAVVGAAFGLKNVGSSSKNGKNGSTGQ